MQIGTPSPRYTLEERKQIEEGLANKFNIAHIARLLGKSKSGVFDEVRRGRLNGQYNAEYSHKLCMNNVHQRHKFDVSHLKPDRSVNGAYNLIQELQEKISILEMQLEIVIQQMKEKNDRHS